MIAPGRTHKALLSAAFSYGQFAVALGAVFFVTPLILRVVGTRPYGLWLSSGELAGYFLLLDFGVFAILPWLIARADGRQDTGEIKRVLAHGLAVALALLAGLLLLSAAGWRLVPVVLHLTADDWHALAGPLALLIVLLAVNLPLGIFNPLLGGLQDVGFLGGLNLTRAFLAPILTIVLLRTGHGLYALAVGTALLPPLAGIAAFFRARRLVPDLLAGWPRPTVPGTVRLFRESVGPWLAGMGVQLMERSSAVVLTVLGNPAAVPMLVCSSRVSQSLTQMAWLMPDSALVGLAQLSGEGDLPRLRTVTLSIIRLNLILAGLMACVVLAINPAFVRIWVGERFFGGLPLNLLLAAEVLSASLTHALATVVAVQGHRLSIGLATLLQGAVYLALALGLTRKYSLEGLLAADLVAPFCSTIPIGLWLLRSAHGLGPRLLGADLGQLLVLRVGPCLVLSWAYGSWRVHDASFPELMAVGSLLAMIYLRVMKSPLGAFPIPAGLHRWLRRLRLL